MKEIVAAAFERDLDLLTRNRALLERAAALLLEKETLVETDLHEFSAQLAPAAATCPPGKASLLDGNAP